MRGSSVCRAYSRALLSSGDWPSIRATPTTRSGSVRPSSWLCRKEPGCAAWWMASAYAGSGLWSTGRRHICDLSPTSSARPKSFLAACSSRIRAASLASNPASRPSLSSSCTRYCSSCAVTCGLNAGVRAQGAPYWGAFDAVHAMNGAGACNRAQEQLVSSAASAGSATAIHIMRRFRRVAP